MFENFAVAEHVMVRSFRGLKPAVILDVIAGRFEVQVGKRIRWVSPSKLVKASN